MNYDLEMEKIIELEQRKNRVPRLLLHTCCAPCSSSVITRLSKYFNITVFYYNPNIEPEEEYIKRKEEQIRFLKAFKGVNSIDFLDCDYDVEKFQNLCIGLENEPEGGRRCAKCFRLRLEKTAQVAKENNFDYFGTSLTVSPYKNASILNGIGLSLAKEYNVSYLVSDFKKKDGYKKSIELSREYELYRQDYCGCKYSKAERERYKSLKQK